MSTTTPRSPESTKTDEYSIPVSGSLTLRIYSDTRPHNGKIADIQKGLILVYKGVETVGEGTGFGFPVLIHSGETYFSSTAQVSLKQKQNRTIVRKEFLMDRIARNRLRNVRLENRELRAMLRYVAGVYQRHKGLRSLTLKDLYTRIGVKSSFCEGFALWQGNHHLPHKPRQGQNKSRLQLSSQKEPSKSIHAKRAGSKVFQKICGFKLHEVG